MGNTKAAGSNVLTTEFYTGRCPIRCEMCFANFGANGSQVVYSMYSTPNDKACRYSQCEGTEKRILAVAGKGRGEALSNDVMKYLCGTRTHLERKGGNDRPRNWSPIDDYSCGMGADRINATQKPLMGHHSMYDIPKVPEDSWSKRISTLQGFNGQWLPAVLRVNTMSDSSRAPSGWIKRIKDIWGDDCFFNTNVRAIKAFPKNLRAGLFHKLVVTANPGHQKVYAGLDAFWGYFGATTQEAKRGILKHPETSAIIRSMLQSSVSSEELLKFPSEFYDAILSIKAAENSMTGDGDDLCHFFTPARLGDLSAAYEEFEKNIKFYRVRAFPTIAPHLDNFSDVPVVFTVLRFKTVIQACEFIRKYAESGIQIEGDFLVKEKDDLIARYYANKFNLPIRSSVTGKGQESELRLRCSDAANGSPNAGQWSILHYEGNYFRADKSSMKDLPYVCDRIGRSCKGCGLCAKLDGTADGWTNPAMASIGFSAKPYATSYLCNENGLPVATGGVQRVRGIGKIERLSEAPTIKRTMAEIEHYTESLGRLGGTKGYWSAAEEKKDEAKRTKAAERLQEVKRHRRESGKIEQNRSMTLAGLRPASLGHSISYDSMEQDVFLQHLEVLSEGGDDIMDSVIDAIEALGNYFNKSGWGEDSWEEHWNLHEEAGTLLALCYWWLMSASKQSELSESEAEDMAKQFSSELLGYDVFGPEIEDLRGMYSGKSYWNELFGPL